MDMKRIWVVGVVLIVMVVAGWMRLYDIKHYPAGLFPDEAANGEDALLILHGDWRPFYPRGNGREGLYFFMEAASIATFGVGVWQLHVVSAVIGIATVLAIFFATQVFFGRLAGVLAAFFLATSYWHVTLSRTGFRAILIPLFVAAFTAFVGYAIQAVKRKKQVISYIYAALAGALFAGGFYTYIAYRVMVGVVLGVFVLVLLDELVMTLKARAQNHDSEMRIPHVKRYGKQVLVGILAALIVFAPLGWYFIQHPKDFVGRAGQVSVFNKELQQQYGGGTLLGTIEYSVRETILSFFYGQGDTNWRHNVAGHPLVNPLVGLLFLLGLIWVINGTVVLLYKIVRGEEIHLGMVYPYILLILLGMLAPVVTTAEGIPHGLRSLGLAVPIFMLAGVAGSVSVYWLRRTFARWRWAQSILVGLVLGLGVAGGIYDGALYMVLARNDSEAYYAYRSDLTDVSNYILAYRQKQPDAHRPYLVLDKFSVQTVHFLTHTIKNGVVMPPPHDYLDHPDEAQHAYELLDPATSDKTTIGTGDVIIFTQSTLPDADRYARVHGKTVALVDSRTNRWGQEIMRVYQGTAAAGSKSAASDFDLDAQ